MESFAACDCSVREKVCIVRHEKKKTDVGRGQVSSTDLQHFIDTSLHRRKCSLVQVERMMLFKSFVKLFLHDG